MGRAARWLRGLLGGKKSAEEENHNSSSSSSNEKRRWGFGKSFREKGKKKDKRTPPPPPYSSSSPSAAAAAAARVDEDENQNRRAIAVAAATAAVAEAAVAAAQAAAAVVRLTSPSGRSGSAAGKRYDSAAVKIQAAFRAYLARRALRALKGLVKLQALVRGNIVRKQAAETLRCMQALVRVQARTRACRALRADRNRHSKSGSHPGPPTPDKCEQAKPVSSTLKRNSSKTERAQPSGWNWLDRWMEERYWDSRVSNKSGVDDEKNAKILEVDTGKPNIRRKSSYHHLSDQNSQSFNTMPDSPSKDSTVAQSPSSIGMQSPSPLRFPVVIGGGEYAESPHFSALSRPGSSRRGPFTPAKSDCSRSLFSAYSDYPSYMANTESSRAKVRSQSAPKQRPPEFEKSGSVRRVSGHGLPQPSQKSSSLQSKFANKAYPGSGRLDRLGMPIR